MATLQRETNAMNVRRVLISQKVARTLASHVRQTKDTSSLQQVKPTARKPDLVSSSMKEAIKVRRLITFVLPSNTIFTASQSMIFFAAMICKSGYYKALYKSINVLIITLQRTKYRARRTLTRQEEPGSAPSASLVKGSTLTVPDPLTATSVSSTSTVRGIAGVSFISYITFILLLYHCYIIVI